MTQNRDKTWSMDRIQHAIREFASCDSSQRKTWWTFLHEIFWSVVPASKSPRFNKLREPATILVSGLDGAGKTTLLYQQGQRFAREVEYRSLFVGAILEGVRCGPACFLLACDIGGARPDVGVRFEMAHYQVCDALVYIVDSTDRDRMVEAREELFHGLAGTRNYPGIKRGVPVLVLANKQQQQQQQQKKQPDAVTPEEIAKILNISPPHQSPFMRELMEDRSLRVMGVDIRSGQGVSEALTWLIEALNDQRSEAVQSQLEEKKTLLDV